MPRPSARAVLLALLAASIAPACAGGSQSGSTAAAPRRDPRRLSLEEIEEAQAASVSNLYTLIQSRRPEWLRSPYTGVTGRSTMVAVWMDRMRLGGPSELRNLTLAMVESVRYLRPSEAQAELGLDNIGGAIVITRRQ